MNARDAACAEKSNFQHALYLFFGPKPVGMCLLTVSANVRMPAPASSAEVMGHLIGVCNDGIDGEAFHFRSFSKGVSVHLLVERRIIRCKGTCL